MLKFVLFCALLHLAVSQHQTCHTDADCGSSQCCTSTPLGRRKRLLFDEIFGSHHSGVCWPLATHGHSCEPDVFGLGGSVTHSFGCPCGAGLECHSSSESHTGGSHTFTNPTCVDARTGGTGTGTGGTGSGFVTAGPVVTSRPVVTNRPVVVDPNQPIHELPGK